MKAKLKRFLLTPLTACSLALVFALVLSGCDDDNVTEPEGATPAQTLASASDFVTKVNTPDSLGEAASQFNELDPQARAKAQVEAMAAIDVALSKADDWQAADRKVRALLQGETLQDPLYHRQQVAAHLMLKKRLLDAPTSRERQEAVGFYTDLLVKNGNTQAPIILQGLQALEGHWSQDRIAKAARQAARSAHGQLDKADCEDCPSAQAADIVQTEVERIREARATREAVKQLRAMSRQ